VVPTQDVPNDRVRRGSLEIIGVAKSSACEQIFTVAILSAEYVLIEHHRPELRFRA
jgi:hypothetical protein